MKFFAKSAFSLLFVLFSTLVYAQSDFEGKIEFGISYINLPEQMKAYESMLPKDMTITLKNNKSRLEQSQMMGTNVIISDMDSKTGFIEMDMAGQKLRMLVPKAEFEKEEEKTSNIAYLDETKTILGYPCKKAIIKDDNGAEMMSVFYTEKISNKAQKEFVGLKGFPLQYSLNQQNMEMEITATDITKQNVPDDTFEKRDGYKEVSQDDLQKMMMGGGN